MTEGILGTKQEKTDFYKKVFALVLPMALQNLINTGITTADVVMLGKVGETVLSGASLAGQIQFVLNLFFFGITSGATVLTAQYWGKGDCKTIEKILGIALRLAIMMAGIFMTLSLVIPEKLMHIFTSDPLVVAEGAKYLQMVAPTYLFMAVTMVYLNIARSIERVVISTLVYLVSLFINVVGNAVFIFGLFGFLAMGIEGAALSTLIARAVELAIVLFYAKYYNKVIQIRISDIFARNPVLFADFLKYSLPVVLNELIWGAGFSANSAIIGHLNQSVVAANSVAQVARNLATVVSFGVAAATAIILGKVIGENKQHFARIYAKRLVKLSLFFGILGGAMILLARPWIIQFFAMSDLAQDYMEFMFLVMAGFVVCQSLNTTIIVGVFRAGGDTRVGLFIDAGTMWCGSILLGFFAAFVFHAPVKIVYLILLCDELWKLPFSFGRMKQEKWLNNVTRS